MPRYQLFGRALSSDMALPELQAVALGASTALRFERRLPAPVDGPWFAVWRRPDGDPWLRACRTEDGYRLEYGNYAAFDIDRAGRAIAGDTIECTDDMFRHLLVDQVVALAMSLETPVLHASSVAIDGQLVAFAGPSGAGKSTIATALARRGHAIGADDALLVEARDGGVGAVPSYPGVRLWDDSERAVAADLSGAGRTAPIAKQRFSSGLRFVRGEQPLTHVYVLDPASAVGIGFERLSPRDAMIELLRETYRLALDDRAAMAREFDALTAVASHVPCWRLSFPRRLDAWRTLAADVEAHIRGSAIRDSRTSDIGPRASDVGPRTSELPA
jgi:hypothetical protein